MKRLLTILLLVLVVIGGLLWWQKRQSAPTAQTQAPQVVPPSSDAAQTPPTPPDASLAAPLPEQPAIKFPIEPVPEQGGKPPVAAGANLSESVTALAGKDKTLSYLHLDGLANRFVVTVDNLARPHAAPRLWPVNPTPDRFTVDPDGTSTVIGASNAARYKPFVNFAQSVDAKRAVEVYTHFYPDFQAAYEEIGYPGQYFNDRFVAVIDDLLATPEVEEPIKVELTEIKGDVNTQRPWVRYQYVDSRLQALSAGQKMMLRMGSENRKIVKAKLQEIRAEIARGAPAQ
ncbi:DUF3014 domain-containing protein [Pigmentiphaga aceris]|uniref:DUF3014 domain-containing protein n=1 Tax=Pigmentiphaga aceris TaxID=1940612 RepID=A0A5C0ARN5_9BURK|nr:DUF3014 domain-containing protein [Pigmentiphaga aceris]QEI04625.1 DUF3014 domain-containing protein [Pigmentiphaga aceris]